MYVSQRNIIESCVTHLIHNASKELPNWHLGKSKFPVTARKLANALMFKASELYSHAVLP